MTFTTPPLKKDVVIAGPTEVNLRAALSATDGNLVVRLMDVEPSGASIIVAGVMGSPARATRPTAVWAEPG